MKWLHVIASGYWGFAGYFVGQSSWLTASAFAGVGTAVYAYTLVSFRRLQVLERSRPVKADTEASEWLTARDRKWLQQNKDLSEGKPEGSTPEHFEGTWSPGTNAAGDLIYVPDMAPGRAEDCPVCKSERVRRR